MLGQSFCNLLEYKLRVAFKSCDIDDVQGFWCDGVLLFQPGEYYSKKYVNDNRIILLKAFIGKDGQSEYNLLLKLGSKTLSRFARDLDILECIPFVFNGSNFIIDIPKHEIKIQLD